ncbi:MAG: ABC-2 family transporter protein [Verrucomicrobiae bacterium]|nr:ABC-2 family transporter protein [Verrucomicrobiae bacterium]
MIARYWHVFLIGFQNALVYRWNFLLRCCFSLVPLLGTIFFWGAIYQGKGNVGGYSYEGMISYFVALLVLDALTSPTEDDFQIAADIREGMMNQVLLKPVNYGAYRLALYFSGRMVYAMSTIIPVGMAVFWLRSRLNWPKEIDVWLLTVLAVVGSGFLQFAITFCTGLLAFWLLDVGGVIFILFGLEYVAGGHVFPLNLLPQPFYQVALHLPFAYEYYFPIAVFGGQLSEGELWRGFLLQWIWIGLVSVLGWVTWRQGLKKYTAVGG